MVEESDDVGRRFEKFRSGLRREVDRRIEPNLRRKQGASDIVASAIADALEHLHQFDGSTDPELYAWLRAIVLNKLKQKRRDLHSQKRDIGREQSIGSPRNDSDDGRLPEIAGELNFTEGKVAGLLRRGVERLGKILSYLDAPDVE